jgi:ABC-2 type transport system permease protein
MTTLTSATTTVEQAAQTAMLRPRSRPRAIPILLRQLRAELRLNVRSPEFVVPVLALPIVLYLIFGAPRANETIPGGTVGLYTMVGFSIYGVLNVVLFAIGQAIADERGRGWLRLVRTTPLPSWAYLASKLALATVLSIATILLIGAVGTLTGVAVPLDRWLAVLAVLTIGGLAIAPMGFLVGFLAPPHGASAVALLILFPLSLASGVFMPVDQLPGVVQDLSMLTPTYHLSELAYQAAGFGRDGETLTHVATMAAWCAAGLAAVAVTYRRMVASQFA